MKNTLEQIMRHYNHTASEFAENVGIQRSSISHFLSGRNNPSLDVIRKILSAYPDINSDWLILGEGDMLLTTLNREKETSYTKQNDINIAAEPSAKLHQPHLFNQIVEEEEQAPYYTEKDLINMRKSEEEIFTTTKREKGDNGGIERVIIFYRDGTFKEYKSNE